MWKALVEWWNDNAPSEFEHWLLAIPLLVAGAMAVGFIVGAVIIVASYPVILIFFIPAVLLFLLAARVATWIDTS